MFLRHLYAHSPASKIKKNIFFLHRHMVRNPNWSYALDDNGPEPMLTFEGEDPKVAEGEWVAAPVKKGRTGKWE